MSGWKALSGTGESFFGKIKAMLTKYKENANLNEFILCNFAKISPRSANKEEAQNGRCEDFLAEI